MSIEFKLTGMKEALEFGDPKMIKKVITKTLNKIGTQAMNAASKDIRKTYNIEKKRIDAALKMKKVKDLEHPEVIIDIRSRPIGLQNFGAWGTERGVMVKVRLDKGWKMIENVFMAKGINFGDRGDVTSGPKGRVDLVFERTGESKRLMSKGRYAGTNIKREPVKKLNTTDVVGMMNTVGTEAVKRTIEKKMGEIFDKELNRELKKM